jgi:CheY-like chemotaxis protein
MMEREIITLVLMADDDEDDCFLAREALGESGAEAAFACVRDGLELLDYLFKKASPEPRRLPNLILLDLNMPQKDGRQALLEIKAQPGLREIPVVVLTTSEEEKDKCFAREAGADLFITKPATFSEWVEIMKSLSEKWLK